MLDPEGISLDDEKQSLLITGWSEMITFLILIQSPCACTITRNLHCKKLIKFTFFNKIPRHLLKLTRPHHPLPNHASRSHWTMQVVSIHCIFYFCYFRISSSGSVQSLGFGANFVPPRTPTLLLVWFCFSQCRPVLCSSHILSSGLNCMSKYPQSGIILFAQKLQLCQLPAQLFNSAHCVSDA